MTEQPPLLRRLVRSFLTLAFPPVCAGCGRPGSLFCEPCQAQVVWLREPLCQKCGRPVSRPGQHCYNCRQQPLPLQQIRAAAVYRDPLGRAIRRMKYSGTSALAEPLAGLMLAAWPQWQTAVDLVLPIPLYPERERKRGYNQSALLVQQLCQSLQWTTATGALWRTRHTRPQVELSGRERLQNVVDAFQADPAVVAGKSILLVDDVCTTGATMAAAAQALLAAGAGPISGYCIARVTQEEDHASQV